MLLLVLLLLANGVESSKSKAFDYSLLSTEPVQSLYFLTSTVKLCVTIWFKEHTNDCLLTGLTLGCLLCHHWHHTIKHQPVSNARAD